MVGIKLSLLLSSLSLHNGMKKAFIRPGEKKRAEITGRKANPVVYVLVLKLSVVIRFAEAVEGEEEEEAMMTMERRKRFSVNVAEMKNVEDNRDHDQKKQKKLDLSGLSLDIFPTSTLNLSAVTVLDLSNNNLKVIPESLTARLLNLVVMDVHSNQLETLPNSLGCLSKLKVLNVSGNLLHTLPKTIEDCKSLEELVANFNKLTMLPETMGFELTNLQKLLVNSNKLDFLPFSTSHMTMLRLLDARLNCLQSLPEGLENLIRLEVLNVSQNFQHLRSIPPSVGLLLSLTELDISYNCISTLPESLGCLMKLQKFHVEGNPLVCPPMEVFEHGLDAVRSYLGDRMNGAHESRPKKSSWIGKFVKYATFSEGMMPNAAAIRAERDEFLLSDYRSIDGHASPRFMSMFSPRRLFSPRRSKSGHQTN